MADGTSVASAGLGPSKTTCPRRCIGAVTPERQRRARMKRMRRTLLNSCRMLKHQRHGFRDKWKMVTLTYGPGRDWKASDVRDYLHRVRKWVGRRRWHFAYLWVMELHKSGVPHYHVLIRIPYGGTLPKSDEIGWWPHGCTNTVTARNAIGYLAKYASKGTEHGEFPKGARIHGAAGLTKESRLYVAFWNLPVWMREHLNGPIRTIRLRGGFVVPSTGEFLPSPYEVDIVGGVPLIYLKDQ